MTKKTKLNQEEIGKRLRQVREALNLTIEKMYYATGFSRSLISEAENGLKKPSSTYLFALLDLYKVNLNYIMSGRGEMFLGEELVLEDFGKDARNVKSLLIFMKKADVVRYTILKYFLEYKAQFDELIRNQIEDDNGK
jgi:transcriptional regulator with XRE-family HTH domain